MKKQILSHAKRTLGVALALCLAVTLLTPVPAHASSSIVGSWSANAGDFTVEFSFSANGQVYVVNYDPDDLVNLERTWIRVTEGTYTATGNSFRITSKWSVLYDYDTYELTPLPDSLSGSDYTISGNAITMVDPDGTTMVLTKSPPSGLWDFGRGASFTGAKPPLDSASLWAREGITAAIKNGYVPVDLQINYRNFITRQEFCRIAVKWVEYVLGKNIDAILSERNLTRNYSAFTDTNDPDILAAFALNITSGVGNNQFNPGGQFTREQAATMIMNACRAIGVDINNPPASGFADLNTAASWAVNGINFVRAKEIMSGTGNNNFSPKSMYTREQSIQTFNNINHAALLAAAPPNALNLDFTVHNKTELTVFYVYISPVSDKDWGKCWLESNEIIYRGESRRFTFDPKETNRSWDIRLEFDDDSYIQFPGIDLSAFIALELTHVNGELTGRWVSPSSSTQIIDCPDCSGTGNQIHEACGGTGVRNGRDCAACRGTGRSAALCRSCSGLGRIIITD